MDTMHLIFMLGGAAAFGCGLGIALAYMNVRRACATLARAVGVVEDADGLHKIGHTTSLGSLGPDSLDFGAVLESARFNYDEYKKTEQAMAVAREAIHADPLWAWLPWRRVAFWWRNRRRNAGWPQSDDMTLADYVAVSDGVEDELHV
jgi:hypothetical protein